MSHEFFRDKMDRRPALRRRSGRRAALAVSALAVLFCSAVAASAAAPQIGAIEADGGDLHVAVEVPDGHDPTELLKLRLLDGDDGFVSVVSFSASPGTTWQSIDGQFGGLATRGWQHRVALEDSTGEIDSESVRFGLNCHETPCEVVAAPGTLIENAIGVGEHLAPLFSTGGPVDLEEVLASEPDLAGSIYETSVDLARMSNDSRCQCFFTAGVQGGGLARSVISARWEPSVMGYALFAVWSMVSQSEDSLAVDHTSYKQTTMDFGCFDVDYDSSVQLQINGGWLDIPIANLTPCQRPCSASVTWSLEDYDWMVHVDTSLDVATTAAYDFDWTVDGSTQFQDDQEWIIAGAQFVPYSLSGSTPLLSTQTQTSQLPTSSQVGGWAGVSVADVGEYDRPQVEVSAGATLVADGKAKCALDARVEARPTELGPGMTPTTLTVVLGPEDEP